MVPHLIHDVSIDCTRKCNKESNLDSPPDSISNLTGAAACLRYFLTFAVRNVSRSLSVSRAGTGSPSLPSATRFSGVNSGLPATLRICNELRSARQSGRSSIRLCCTENTLSAVMRLISTGIFCSLFRLRSSIWSWFKYSSYHQVSICCSYNLICLGTNSLWKFFQEIVPDVDIGEFRTLGELVRNMPNLIM